MAEQQQNLVSPSKEKPDIEFPDVVHDHKQQILEHKSSAHHNIDMKKEQIIEEQEEQSSKTKHLPHLKFDEQKEANIGIKSLGVRDSNQHSQQHNEDLKPKDTLIEEENEDDQLSNSRKKFHHLQFEGQNQKSLDIQFQGRVTENSASPRVKSQSMQLNEIKEEDDGQARRPRNVSELSKFHDTLTKIEREIDTLEKDSKNSPLKKLKKQKSSEIKESIQEQEDELIEEKSNIIDHQIQHKDNKLGSKLKKLEKEITSGSDDIDIRQKQQTADMTKSISNKLSNSKDAIVEEEKVEED